ncbi:TetR/AcrR family transcriptional regulator [Pontiella desulfatans]|nr:TetR/AcrR family transcriptional regulator [Pontiella desulfatans]
MNIIDAAGTLAAAEGFASVSTRKVAEASGENIGSIHYHFGGKDGLFAAVVREAMSWCLHRAYYDAIDAIDENSTREELAKVVRIIVSSEINDLFRSDRPAWHSQVIYQLLQRDDELYELFRAEVLEPSTAALERFLKAVDPTMDETEVFQRTITMKMPIFAHANYMKVFLKALGVEGYSEDYLSRLEDLLVRQAQLSLGLPVD